jgi:hypothetical protein
VFAGQIFQCMNQNRRMESPMVQFKKLKPFIPLQKQRLQELEEKCKQKSVEQVRDHVANIRYENVYKIKYCLKHGFDEYVKWKIKESNESTPYSLTKHEREALVYYSHRYKNDNIKQMVESDCIDFWKWALYGACKAGNVATAKKYITDNEDDIFTNDETGLPDQIIIENALYYAAASGNTEMLGKLLCYCTDRISLEPQSIDTTPIENLCKYADLYGEDIDFAIEHMSENVHFTWNFKFNRCFYTVSKRKRPCQVKMLEYLSGLWRIGEYGTPENEPNWSDALMGACEDGNLELIEYIQMQAKKSQTIKWKKPSWFNDKNQTHKEIVLGPYPLDWKQAFKGACVGGQLRILRYILQLKLVQPTPDVKDVAFLQGCFDIACENGHLEIVEYMYNKFFKQDKEIIKCGIYFAIKSNNLDLVKYLFPLLESNEKLHKYTCHACSHSTTAFHYLVSLNNKKGPSQEHLQEYFEHACKKEELSILCYCIQQKKLNTNALNKLLEKATLDDAPQVIQLLLKNGATNINQAFQLAIKNRSKSGNRVLHFFASQIGNAFQIHKNST